MTNRKEALFRDIIIESEYDPLRVNRGCIKAKPPTRPDPTRRVIDKYEQENAIIASGKDELEEPKVDRGA